MCRKALKPGIVKSIRESKHQHHHQPFVYSPTPEPRSSADDNNILAILKIL
jgi:hypothetical protein